MTKRKLRRVLFLCTHNSARSQMAEGLLRRLGGDAFEVYSAGTETTTIHPLAIRAMREVGIDITQQDSKTLDRYVGQEFDAVITVCDDARDACPVFPGARAQAHWRFPDPSRAQGTEDERLAAFRAVRNVLRARIQHELFTGAAPWFSRRSPPARGSGPAAQPSAATKRR